MTTRPGVSARRAQVVAYRLAASHLVDRLPATGLVDAAAPAVQDTPAGNAAVALGQRVDGVAAADVERAVVAERSLVATWSVRGAPHVVPAADLDLFTLGARPVGEASWRAWLAGAAPDPAGEAAAAAAVGTVLDAVVGVLAGAGPLTKAELSEALHGRLPGDLEPWCAGCAVHHVREQLLRATGLSGRVCFGPPRNGRATLVLTASWLGREPGGPAGEARAGLVRRFLRHAGPRTPALFAAWAGIGAADAAASWAAADADLVPVSVDGRPARLHGDDLEAFMSPPPATGARLLPAGDPLLAPRDRDVLVPDRAVQRRLWRAIGGPGLAVVDGRAAALWRARMRGRRLAVALEPLEALDGGALAALAAEAERLAALAAEAERLAAFRGATSATVDVAEA